ncbi:Peptidyl-prolyl cis-trans isomerase B [Armadillidium nasatum]|uniref:Peptidyl-prolyl cis-trans isomerase n=1 Tax=Armadillidium nasatum TaxID=96803 RepID=A0A5N5TMY5_9CRUS|nr:Peptidyl-prolyl cis-trans isomerase B [Armadillidium nasatum]
MYAKLICHILSVLLSGGDVISGDGKGRISIFGDSFPDENFEIRHSTAGYLSMANSGKDTNGCQFFITTLQTDWLDGKHVVFGKVIEGQSLVHKIEYLEADHKDMPLKEVKIAQSGSRPLSNPYWISISLQNK